MSHASRDRQTRPSRRFVSLPQAAEYVGVTRRTLERVINRGELTAYRLGKRCTRVDLDELEELMLRGAA